MTAHRYTLRGKIGERPPDQASLAGDRLPAKVTLAIGVYVVSAIGGWLSIGVLIAVVAPS